jgi:hypothetical protein
MYDSDFYTWTQQQAQLLKSGQFDKIDVEHIIEEIESMGRSERRELESRLTILLQHLLKWQYQPLRRGRSWQLSIKGQRIDLVEVLDENPGLKPQLADILSMAYRKAKLKASEETALDETVFPADCPWSIVQLIDDAYLPD